MPEAEAELNCWTSFVTPLSFVRFVHVIVEGEKPTHATPIAQPPLLIAIVRLSEVDDVETVASAPTGVKDLRPVMVYTCTVQRELLPLNVTTISAVVPDVTLR